MPHSCIFVFHGLCHCFLVGCRENEGPVLALGRLEVDGADYLQVAHPLKAVPAVVKRQVERLALLVLVTLNYIID